MISLSNIYRFALASVAFILVFGCNSFGASDLKQRLEEIISKDSASYKCKQSGEKVTCQAYDFSVGKDSPIVVNNYKISVTPVSKDNVIADFSFDMNMSKQGIEKIGSSEDIATIIPFMPNRGTCKIDSSMKYGSGKGSANYDCKAIANNYDISFGYSMDIESQELKNNDALDLAFFAGALGGMLDTINEAIKTEDRETLKKYAGRINNIKISLDNRGIDSVLYLIMQQHQSDLTKDQYNALVDLSAAYVPVFVAQQGLSQKLGDKLTQISAALAGIAKGDKNHISIKMNKKSPIRTFDNLIDFANNDMEDLKTFFNYLDTWNIEISAK